MQQQRLRPYLVTWLAIVAFGILSFRGVTLGFFTVAIGWSRNSLRPRVPITAIGLVVILLHAYWLVPAVRSLAAGDEVRGHHSVASLYEAYAKMYENTSAPLPMAVIGYSAISGMEHEHVYPEYRNNNPTWFVVAYALVALALVGVFYKSRLGWLPRYAAFSMAFGIVLLAGCHTPFGRFIYESVLARVSVIFYLMACATRWMPLYYVGASLLIGMGTQCLLNGNRRPKTVGLSGPSGYACDLVVFRNGTSSTKALEAIAVECANPGRYRIRSQSGQNRYLVFAESFHPDWRILADGETSSALQGLGLRMFFQSLRAPAISGCFFFLKLLWNAGSPCRMAAGLSARGCCSFVLSPCEPLAE